MTQELMDAILNVDKLAKSVEDFDRRIKDASEVISRQTKMLEIALDVIIAVVGDETVESRVRRRLVFALQQVRGIGMPS